MSHQKYTSHDAVKEPHSVSVKVLRLSQPSLETQYPIEPPLTLTSSASSSTSTSTSTNAYAPASLAYSSSLETNSDPFILSPILTLPASFGSAYVGETFSCTLCANNDLPADSPKQIRDVRIEAEMKTPGLGGPQKLELSPATTTTTTTTTAGDALAAGGGVDLGAGDTLQKVLGFDLKEEGNHVLAVTVSYYEATETSGRTRTFRKLYQFICKASLIVRTKISNLDVEGVSGDGKRRWVLEAQLENCSEDVMLLEKVVLDMEDNLGYQDCNWDSGTTTTTTTTGGEKPVLHPAEVEQVCFVVQEKEKNEHPKVTPDGRLIFGVLGIGWRGERGKRGFLSTGKLGARILAT